jgi:dolichol-phosphate mannosyltransferase
MKQPDDIEKMIKKMGETKADIVFGSRYIQGGGIFGWNLYRKITSRVGNLLSYLSTGVTLSDFTNSFRVYKTDVFRDCIQTIKSMGFAFQMEMVIRAKKYGYKIEECPVYFVDRIYGASKLGNFCGDFLIFRARGN